ncbi:MAG: DUF427 domain-containing protein [Maricaulis sp.]|uniref:DUF427 domain-containing protein n=1 Tax=Maricaulis sp. TaxID=1486257 RepID=UPI0026216E38|nr:DUF427 domain-containing protein [Maricaulis sp.]MDM7983986.1 DUF427 domain-containing protein [Maricaulis sp.]
MTDTKRPVLQPGPEHPIHISDQEIDVVVSARGELLAIEARAIELKEHVYAPVLYVDRRAIEPRLLERSEHTSWCPYKGEANYFHLTLESGERLENVVWTYETPFEAVAPIQNRLGFYPDRVEVTPR